MNTFWSIFSRLSYNTVGYRTIPMDIDPKSVTYDQNKEQPKNIVSFKVTLYE
jgi:hypothetical protein